MDWADISYAVKDVGRTKDFTDNCDIVLLSLMKECGGMGWIILEELQMDSQSTKNRCLHLLYAEGDWSTCGNVWSAWMMIFPN